MSSPSIEKYKQGLQTYTALGQFLEKDGWHPKAIQEKYAYQMNYKGKNGRVACFAQIRIDLDQFMFYVVLPEKIPEAVRPAVSEFVTRANYGLRIGNFEMDFSDGDLRYKASLDFEGTTLEEPLIKNAMYFAVKTMDRYLPSLMAVIHQKKSPLEAITTAEDKK